MSLQVGPMMQGVDPTTENKTKSPRVRWVPWVVGAALLATLIAAVSQLAEEREFAHLVESAQPAWLLVAAALQAATYVAQAEVFRAAIPMAAQRSLSRAWLYELSLTKLFLDQALPSAGVSSTAMIVKALESRRVSRSVAAACAMINIASYHAAYVVALFGALAITSMLRETSWVLVSLSGFFIVFAIAMSVGIIALAGRQARPGSLVTRVPGLKGVVQLLERAEATLVRDPRVLRRATMWQLAIVLLDTATMWGCLRAIGADAPPDAVFASFMVASLVRTMGVVPGGLGTYEATSVFTLRLLGIGVSAALSATLMFRGLSFWIPMLPGLWSSRRILRPVS
jgi:P-type Mg2+ transporter